MTNEIRKQMAGTPEGPSGPGQAVDSALDGQVPLYAPNPGRTLRAPGNTIATPFRDLRSSLAAEHGGHTARRDPKASSLFNCPAVPAAAGLFSGGLGRCAFRSVRGSGKQRNRVGQIWGPVLAFRVVKQGRGNFGTIGLDHVKAQHKQRERLWRYFLWPWFRYIQRVPFNALRQLCCFLIKRDDCYRQVPTKSRYPHGVLVVNLCSKVGVEPKIIPIQALALIDRFFEHCYGLTNNKCQVSDLSSEYKSKGNILVLGPLLIQAAIENILPGCCRQKAKTSTEKRQEIEKQTLFLSQGGILKDSHGCGGQHRRCSERGKNKEQRPHDHRAKFAVFARRRQAPDSSKDRP